MAAYSKLINLELLTQYDGLIKQYIQSGLSQKSDTDHTHNIADIIKHGTKSYWQQSGYIPEKGELIIVDDYSQDAEGNDIPAIKIGDGLAYAIDLPAVSDEVKDMITSHISDTVMHLTAEERSFWNDKWRGYISGEQLVFTTE